MDDLKLYVKDQNQLDSLVNTVQIFSLDIGMKLSTDKREILVLKRDRYEISEDIKLPDEQEMKEIDVENGYIYMGILETDGLKEQRMKEKLQKEYTRQL